MAVDCGRTGIAAVRAVARSILLHPTVNRRSLVLRRLTGKETSVFPGKLAGSLPFIHRPDGLQHSLVIPVDLSLAADGGPLRRATLSQREFVRTMIQPNVVKSDNIAKVLDRALDKGGGLLRLTPTWVPRSFLHPGPPDQAASRATCTPTAPTAAASTSAGSPARPKPPTKAASGTKG